ncbi:beta-1,3-glucan-binding protein-like [Osmia bicornis bicornis]|uniref:beta-1,3-glucan-binding protein-like n=1 Tax=Osmia bicornis bicornis TaxID=1437191 RepID=UPI001EAEDAE9|nr:beta-1,3-glucan-binding protein-like [Osmia bicornis bicornis]
MTTLPTKMLLLEILLLLIVVQENFAQYLPPTPTVEPLYPKGLRMSIPHEDGISLVAYHVKFNEDFNGLEAGTIARDIVKARNGRWTYEDRTTRLKRGQTIYYWIHVVYDGLGYNLVDQQHEVNEFYNYDGTPVSAPTGGSIVCARPSETRTFETDRNTPQTNRQNICPGQLLFEDNFDTLDSSRWRTIERFSNAPNYEFVVYKNDRNNVDVWDGVLHIRPTLTNVVFGRDFIREGTLTLEKCTSEIGTANCKQVGRAPFILPPVIAGRINSKPSFLFLYGHVQIRAKLPRGDWLYPLITLESTEGNTDDSKAYCEIIIAHSVGNPSLQSKDGKDFSGHLLQAGGYAVSKDNQNKQNNRLNLLSKNSSSLWSDSYHVFDLIWKPGQVVVKVDNEQYGEQQLPPLYDTPLYLNFGVAVGGHVVFPNTCTSGLYEKPWKNLSPKALNDFYQAESNWLETWHNSDTGLHIDYVKVWAI